jgi:phage-related protein
MVIERFKVQFLQEAADFLESVDSKTREKIIYNIRKAQVINDSELFKKLNYEIWEFRTLSNKQYIRLFAFWDKTSNTETVVISTHGIVKKIGKTPKSDLEKAEKLRLAYFKEKFE